MKRTSLVSAAILAAAWSSMSLATNLWKDDMPLLSVHTLGNGSFVLTGPVGSAAACGASGSQFYVQAGQNGQTADGVKAALALAVSAVAMGRSVTVLYDDTSSSCYVQVIQLKSE